MTRNRKSPRGYRQSRGNTSNNNFKVIQPGEITVSFDEIIGHQECKKDLGTLLNYLKDPALYEQYGVSPYCKYLLVGPDGVGKSTLALAIAKSANLPVVSVEPSFFFNPDKLESEVDNLFQEVGSLLKAHSNCVLLLKDMQYLTTLGDEIEQPLLEQLLAYFRELPNLVAFATLANNEQVEVHQLWLEKPAFNKVVQLMPPELKVREQIIKDLLQSTPVDEALSINRLALDTYQMTTGDIKKLLNDAILQALQNGRKEISYCDFAEAMAQSEFGYANARMNDDERLATARHEAGHVIAGYFSDPKNYKVSKVEITPRAYYLGITESTADEEKKQQLCSDIENHIILCYGGMASEEHYYKETSAGVSNDLAQATALAVNYHKAYGMSSAIGPVCLSASSFSLPGVSRQADREIQTFLKRMYVKTQVIIRKHQDALDELTKALMDNEVLYSEQVMAILEKYNK